VFKLAPLSSYQTFSRYNLKFYCLCDILQCTYLWLWRCSVHSWYYYTCTYLTVSIKQVLAMSVCSIGEWLGQRVSLGLNLCLLWLHLQIWQDRKMNIINIIYKPDLNFCNPSINLMNKQTKATAVYINANNSNMSIHIHQFCNFLDSELYLCIGTLTWHLWIHYTVCWIVK